MINRKFATLVALIGMPLAANAATFGVGDVFVSVGDGRVAQLDAATLTVKATLNTGLGGFTTGSTFDKAGNFYVTGFTSNWVSKFDNTGALVDATFAQCDAGAACESIVFDAAGNFYVGQANGTQDILKFNSGGTLLDRYDVQVSARGSDWIDLAADQKTMYYTSENFEVFTYDLDADAQGAQFATLADRPAFALRLLGDGGLLVSDSADIKRLDSTGATIQSYDLAGNGNWFSLNIDPNGSTFWAGDFGTNILAEFNIATGALVRSVDLDSLGLGGNFFGVSVFGERQQGGGGVIVDPEVIPLPAAGWLLMGGLFGLAALRRRRS